MAIPREKSIVLDRVTVALERISGLRAIALGGSHARGTEHAQSDLDIGLYYDEAQPFAIEDVRQVATDFSKSGTPTVTGFYEWGPFVNGGAWIDNDVCKIDFLYRNIDQLKRAIAEAQAGDWSHNFDQHPPFGFRSVTLLGEIACCKPLRDPSGVLASLKESVATYPPKLKIRIIQDSLWLAEFSFLHAFMYFASDGGDVPNTVATMTRIYHYLVQALYALNGCYLVNDKRSLREIEAFPRVPEKFGERVSAILGHPGENSEALNESLRRLKCVFDEITGLAGDLYRPRFAVTHKT